MDTTGLTAIVVRPARSLVILAGLAAVALSGYMTIATVLNERALWQPLFGTFLVCISVVLFINFWNFFAVVIEDSSLVQRRFFRLWNRRVPLGDIDVVELDTVENFMNAVIVRIRIEWPRNLIQLTSSVYRESDLIALVQRLEQEGVSTSSNLRDWLRA
jgi:hypothetical protein